MAVKFTTLVRNARLDAVTAYAGTSAIVRIYSGTAPADANTALAGNTVLAELACSATLAPAASGGVLTLSTITQDSSADATGTATFYRWLKSDATTVIQQGTVSTSGADLNLNTTSIVIGGPVSVTSWTLTDGNA
jgi:hypothetical protein